MTSRGRKVLSVTSGDSSPKGRAKASYIGTRNGAYLYRYAPFTVLRLPSMRVPPESRMVVKTVSVPAFPLASPCGRGGRAQRGRRGQITATSNRKMLAPSQADDVPRAQGQSVVTALPKESQGIVYWHIRNGAYLYRYAPFTVLRLPLNARAARKSDGRKTVSVPALPLLWERWPSAARRRGQITATSNRKMLAPSQADDVFSQSPVVTALPKGEPRHFT